MKKTVYRSSFMYHAGSVFVLLYLCLVMCMSVISQASEEGFTSLFNGENLDGWVIENGDDRTFQVRDGVIYCPGKDSYPAWLRSEKRYENFDLRFEFRMDGWCNSGVFFHAPLHGRISRVGFEFQIDHKTNEPITEKTAGAIFAVVPPKKNALKGDKEWNTGRILMDWPRLQAWINDELVQDLNVEEYPELKYRLRQGYLGLQDMGYHVWFRNLRIRELPGKVKYTQLFNGRNFDGWYEEGKGSKWSVRDGVIHTTGGTSYMVTEQEFEDFELFTYIRTSRNANGGIFVRWNTLQGGDRGNEIQIENTPDSNYPTGSLYNIVRAEQAHWRDEEWMPLQIWLRGKHLVVRVNGETVVDYREHPTVRKGHIALQMHMENAWIEFKELKIRDLSESDSDETAWQPLFNGENLEGWHQEGNGAKWSIHDGILRAEDGTSYMVTNEEYKNLAVKLKFRSSKHANGGVFLRWKSLQGGDRGNEVQIYNVPTAKMPTGSLYQIQKAELVEYDDSNWTDMEIVLQDRTIQVAINGRKVVDSDQFPVIRDGHLALQMHAQNAWMDFKDIQIKKL